jgi:hypothetical protein
MLQELFGQQRVGRDLAHHDELEVVLAALQAVFGEQIDDRPGLLQRYGRRAPSAARW